MPLTNETLRELLIQAIGFDVGPDEVQRLRPLVERQMGRMRELQALDLGGDDPRTMSYIADRRLTPPPSGLGEGEGGRGPERGAK